MRRMYFLEILSMITLVLYGFVGTGCAETTYPQRTTPMVRAGAGTVDSQLGRPVDTNFEPLAGDDGTSLFPDSKVVINETNEVRHSTDLFQQKSELRANLKVWRIASAGLDSVNDTRYAAVRNYHIKKVVQLDDSSEMRDPPALARYYVYRIYYGHLYEAVASGNKTSLNAGFAARLSEVQGDLTVLEREDNMTVAITGVGVSQQPKEKSLFGKTQRDFESVYQPDYGNPVPIFVEYRSLPTRPAPEDEPIAYEQTTTFKKGEYFVSIDSIKVVPQKADGNAWDGFGGLPEIQARVLYGACQNLIMETGVASDTLLAHWTDVSKVTLGPTDRLCIKIQDVDFSNNDVIGVCETKDMSNSGYPNQIRIADCGQAKEVIITVAKSGR